MGSPIDICFGKLYDLSRRVTQRAVLKLLKSGLVWYVHFGTPCCVWSIARTRVTNIAKAIDKEQLGLEFALVTVECCRELSKQGVFFSIENPATSRLWSFDPIQSLLSLPATFVVDFTMCAYGRPYKKCTRFLSNFHPLRGLERKCPGLSATHSHLPLCGSLQISRGRGKPRWIAATAWAGEYPLSLCRLWARLVREGAPDGALASSHGRGASAGAPSPRSWQARLLAGAEQQHSRSHRGALADGPALPASGNAPRADIGGGAGEGHCALAKAYLASGVRPPFRLGRPLEPIRGHAARPPPPGL